MIHTWNVDTNKYSAITDIPGAGEPIVVWNGFASGQSAKYSLENAKAMAPETPDLLVVNHGHGTAAPIGDVDDGTVFVAGACDSVGD
ncbi:hypothetical protein [Kocuria sp. CNJ-770]|uniref:hypothetical protein n=1 Tax=Kocuria sp. CNJ-770 TaxID=1904964 RepID=UPI00111532FF|nr:hypothetical protein [Kocuria sp. CNJ-770]